MEREARAALKESRRIVVKVGSAVLAPDGVLEVASVERLADDLAGVAASAKGRGVVLVTSGAVASGFRALGLAKPPKEIRVKQAAAAIGQSMLMGHYARAFAGHGLTVGQVLLTAEDVASRKRFLNARHTIETLLDHGVVPIINENDSVSFDEIKLGDNDRLSALTATMIRADALVILSSVSGLYQGGKSGKVIPWVAKVADARREVQSGTSGVGTGGMGTKLDAAGIATRAGIPVVVAGGLQAGVVGRVLAGEGVGTMLAPGKGGLSTLRRWVGFSAKVKGSLDIDDGAVKALVARGASLLPSGVIGVSGTFDLGEPVEIRDRRGTVVARGVVGYSSAEIDKVRGRRGAEIARVLGYVRSEEVVHRDDMVVVGEEVSA
jgi:glutamate 5-kinase